MSDLMNDAIPCVLFGDAPGQTSGLSRILGDLARHISTIPGLDVRTVGWAPYRDLPTAGVQNGEKGWVYGDFASRGRYALNAAWRSWFGTRPGIVLTVWDPARVEAVAMADLPITRWGYFPIDATTPTGRIGGPAGEYLNRYDRVLGYTQFGAGILAKSIDQEVTHLPHGIGAEWFESPTTEERIWAGKQIPPRFHAAGTPVIGCVATNQRRKDLALFADVIKRLPNTYGWLHTDALVTEAWSVPQLLEDFGIADRCTVTLSHSAVPMRAIYHRCDVTIAPGRGEGWGYPITESLACGAPVVHTDYGGGAEQLPQSMLVIPRTFTHEGAYSLLRPVLEAYDFAETVAEILLWQREHPGMDEVRTQKLALPYAWDTCWPAWKTWVEDGIAAWVPRT